MGYKVYLGPLPKGGGERMALVILQALTTRANRRRPYTGDNSPLNVLCPALLLVSQQGEVA